MSPWKDDLEVISDDPEIAGHSEHKFVFTDITYGIADRVCNMYHTILVIAVQKSLRTIKKRYVYLISYPDPQ